MEDEKISAMDDSQIDEGIQEGLKEEGPQVDPSAETGEVAPPEGTPEVPGQEQPPPAPTIEERMARLEEQLAEKERFIQRQGNEIGILRKQVGRPQIDIAKAREEINQQFQTDPAAAVQNMERLRSYVMEVQREQAANTVPDLPDLMDDICEIARAEGEHENKLQAFRQDPYRVPLPVLYDYAVRARAYRYAKAKSAENAELQKQITQLRGRATEEVAARIDHAAKASPVIRGGTGGGTSSTRDATSHSRLTESQIPNLSYEELNTLLSKRKTT